MELNNENNKILVLKWSKSLKDEDSDNCFLDESTIFWKSFKIQIKIRCCWGKGPFGIRTHFDFNVNNEIYSYNLLDSHMKGTNGKLPSIEFGNSKLEILALPYSLEITEKNK